VPAYHGYDGRNGVLVLELIPNAEDLRTRHLRTGAFPAVLGARLGHALGTLHAETRAQYAELPAPWVLSLHRPDVSVFRDISAANIQLIKIVQSTEGFGDRLDDLRRDWHATSLIHQDVKWDNCLVSSDGSDGVRLIDWEVATAGDPAWDVGSALSHYLSFWLFSIPVTGAEPPARFPSLARFRLDAMKEPCRACWEAYADANPDDARGAAFLERSVAYAGGRLVQTAFEASQHAQQLASGAVLHLQLAFNILARPGVAATQLLELAPR
jgi:aminoglycoside phosphotransferase (APT) family kinase protein